jgi:hypothetical protein
MRYSKRKFFHILYRKREYTYDTLHTNVSCTYNYYNYTQCYRFVCFSNTLPYYYAEGTGSSWDVVAVVCVKWDSVIHGVYVLVIVTHIRNKLMPRGYLL